MTNLNLAQVADSMAMLCSLPGSSADKGQDADEGEAEGGDDEDQEEISPEFPDAELDPCDQLKQWGIFIVAGGGLTLDWGVNNCEGKKAPTFWMWEVDPANVYPKGLGSDLIPLQKRLNRIDSLIELAMMANAAGKWLWPTTQSTKPPTGTPTDVIEYDPIGDGKIAPTFVQPSPFHSAVWQLRAAIKQDFLEIGMTEGVQRDNAARCDQLPRPRLSRAPKARSRSTLRGCCGRWRRSCVTKRRLSWRGATGRKNAKSQ
jgi:hypothetical protein